MPSLKYKPFLWLLAKMSIQYPEPVLYNYSNDTYNSLSPPSKFSTGILTLSKYTSAVLDALIPIFFSGGPLVTPPNDRSTMKADILSFTSPVLGSLTGVWANTVNISAIPPLLILNI